ncbi:MAG TPA: VOC family protein [Amycolatopsis sp.]|nr:VOC family protein [Amycolatopsis sp.]
MGAQLVKPVIDIGIVTTNPGNMIDFYGKVLGFPALPDVPMDGFLVRRFQIGDCVLKIVTFDEKPGNNAATGMLGDSTGLRYWTVSVSNLDELLADFDTSGVRILAGPHEVRPGVSIVLVADPDGNIVEFVNRPA